MAIKKHTRKDGTKYFEITFNYWVDPDSGKPVPVTAPFKVIKKKREFGGASRTDARTLLGQRKAEARRGEYVNPRDVQARLGPTFREFVTGTFMERHASQTNSTYYAESLSETGALVAYFGDRRLREITRNDLEWFARQRAKKVSNSTVRKNLTMLGTILKRAKRWEVIEHNPASDVELPPPAEPDARPLSPTEWAAIRAQLTDEADRQKADFLLFTSCRWAEAARLQWSDVDMASGFVTLRQQKGGRWTSKRVALSKPALAALPEPGESTYVFVNGKGGDHDDRWRRNGLCKRFKQACIRAKVPWASLKTLRTTFASWAEEADVPVETTQKALGHRDVRTTQRFYARSQADKTRRAVDAVAAFVDTYMDTRAPADTPTSAKLLIPRARL